MPEFTLSHVLAVQLLMHATSSRSDGQLQGTAHSASGTQTPHSLRKAPLMQSQSTRHSVEQAAGSLISVTFGQVRAEHSLKQSHFTSFGRGHQFGHCSSGTHSPESRRRYPSLQSHSPRTQMCGHVRRGFGRGFKFAQVRSVQAPRHGDIASFGSGQYCGHWSSGTHVPFRRRKPSMQSHWLAMQK